MRFTSKLDQSDNLNGKLIDPNGNTAYVLAKKAVGEAGDKKGGMNKRGGGNKEDVKLMPVTYPNGAYGTSELPTQETILFKNATVWTNESEGILENTDVLVKNGKIDKVGTNLSDSSAKVVDATGKHLTAGVIDEHTHIAAAGINEGGQNSSAEVSIEDVINPEDINIYRNLAGGVTSAQILHGFFYGITIPLLWAMIADVADYSEWKNNRRATAIIFSAMMVGLKLGLTIGSSLVAKILSVYGYIPGNENVQTEFAIQGTKMLISIYPAIPFLIGVSLLFFYEINKKMELQIESDLKARRN
jgi:hypothetical protein